MLPLPYRWHDFAFFVVTDGVVEDRTITLHLSYSGWRELQSPLSYALPFVGFLEWVRSTALPDVEDWMSEDDLLP